MIGRAVLAVGRFGMNDVLGVRGVFARVLVRDALVMAVVVVAMVVLAVIAVRMLQSFRADRGWEASAMVSDITEWNESDGVSLSGASPWS